jgi:cytochrome c peroxidase
MTTLKRLVLAESCLMALLPAVVGSQAEPIVTIRAPEAVDRARVALGEQLFTDVRLSRISQYSCATCHPLDRGGMDARRLATRAAPGAPPRNTPTIFNAALNPSFNWDGAAPTLEAHTATVVETLMGFDWPALVERLRGVPDYRRRFAAAYRSDISKGRIIDAIVSFEQTLVTPNSPFDRYLRGDRQALTDEAKEGYRRFKAYGCASCHQGANAGGNLYQQFGIFEPVRLLPPLTDDSGRIRITNVARDKDVFRVPGLRNVAVTAPYFHDGRATTLEEAVGVMGRHQLGRRLSNEDVRVVTAFLRTLTGEYRGRTLSVVRSSERAQPPGSSASLRFPGSGSSASLCSPR